MQLNVKGRVAANFFKYILFHYFGNRPKSFIPMQWGD